jgi:putative protease
MAYSGRCLLSNYFNHRDANQGVCTNACRWEYKLYQEPEEKQSKNDDYLPLQDHYYLEESERPGTLMPVDEDEHGTYIMNAKDLSAIGVLPRLIDAGIDSIKVEGRTKSVYYVSTITRAYRAALDKLKEKRDVPSEVLKEVFSVANRGYVTGFLEKNPLEKGQNYESGHSRNQTHTFIGIVDVYDESNQMAAIRVRNRFEVGDQLELMMPDTTVPFKVEELYDLEHNPIEVAHGGGKDVRLPLPKTPSKHALLRKKLSI